MNVMDDPTHCDFAAPAVVRRGELTVAVSTGGGSPALARRLREELEVRFGTEWAEALDILAGLRRETLGALPDLGDRARRWAEALDVAELEGMVRAGEGWRAKELLRARLLAAETGAGVPAAGCGAGP